MALVGGTARSSEPLYYDVTTSDIKALVGALNEIAREAMKNCTFVLESPPADPSKDNVYVNSQLLPADGPNGRTEPGAAVTLRGAPCGQVQSDAGPPAVQIFLGCPTIR